MALVPLQFEVIVPKAEQIMPVRIDFHDRQRKRFTAQLGLYLVHVVQVDMHITECVDEIPGFQAD